jgi:hypothetical protein
MPAEKLFFPPRRRGVIVHVAGTIVFGLLCAASLAMGFQQSVGGYFVLLMLLSLIFFAPFSLFLYRGYALLRARYLIERDGLRLRWGLRAEDIPIPDVEWVRPASETGYRLHSPILSWPGALLGSARARELGVVEFMAAEKDTLLLVATPQRVYAISPADPRAFMRAFRETIELGSIQPIASVSVQPAAYLQQIWKDQLARWLVGLGFGLVLLLFVVVSLVIPSRNVLSLGFAPDGSPLPAVPSTQLFLLAVLGAFATVIDLLGGLFFYRQPEGQIIAYLLWGMGIFTPLLLLAATILLL